MKAKILGTLLSVWLFVGCEDPTFSTVPYDNGYGYNYTLLAWPQTSLHTSDANFSVFALNAPYNTLHAQLIQKGNAPSIKKSNVVLSYEPATNSDNTINTTSQGKTNFWDYILGMFGVTKPVDTGLDDYNFSQSMTFNATLDVWEAKGIPLVARDDDNATQFYPAMKLVAKDANGNTLSHTLIAAGVSHETGCVTCHQTLGFRNDANITTTGLTTLQKQKLGILELHDARHATTLVATYDLNRTKSIVCASCHESTSPTFAHLIRDQNRTKLSIALHRVHASTDVVNPLDESTSLEATTDDTACTACHASAQSTHRARDAAHQTLSCQKCHGTVSFMGDGTLRTPGVTMPKCAHCHQGATPTASVFSSGTTLRSVVDTTFDHSGLYDTSSGHESIDCKACHGTAHVTTTSNRSDDTFQSRFWQGEAGTLYDCLACHSTMPQTASGGPHGMHTIGQSWLSEDAHGDAAENNIAACRVCHGSNDRGTRLSRAYAKRELSKRTYAKGETVGCYDCHNGPNGGDD